MKILWIGYHEEGISAFRNISEIYGIDAFITLEDAAFANRSAGTREYSEICTKYNIQYFTVDTIKSENAYKIIKAQKPDLMIVLGWSEILPERLLEVPAIGTIGTHAALLPHNRGSAPINWALIHGESRTGNTLMWLNKYVDEGVIIDQIEFPITIFDTCKTLYDKVAETNSIMIERLIKNLNSGVNTILGKKNETNEPILPRRKPENGLINWNQTSRKIYDFIRALTIPYPGAFTFLNGHKWILWEAAVLPVKCNEVPGTILGTSYGFNTSIIGILISTCDNVLLITQIEDDNGIKYSKKEIFNLNLKGVFLNE